MALLRQHARPMCTRHFKGSSLFEEEILALNPSLFPIHGKSSEILFEHQAEVDSCVVGVGGTKKRGGVNKHPFNCQRQRRKGFISGEIITSLPDHDGYQWRKYGEKKIMNNQFTRCYYRCAYNSEYSCKATKQVQQQDYSNPPIYNVTYFNNHVCPSGSISVSRSQSTNSQQILDFSAKTSSVPVPQYIVQEHGIKKEKRVKTLNMVKESSNGTEEVMRRSVDSTGCLSDGSVTVTVPGQSNITMSDEEFSTSDLCSDQWIDQLYEFNAVISGLEDSEFAGSLFEMYDE